MENDVKSTFFNGCRLTPYKSRHFHLADWKKYYELLTLEDFSENGIDFNEFQYKLNQVAERAFHSKLSMKNRINTILGGMPF